MIPISKKPFVWVDTETTGLEAGHHEILEIAILREDTGEIFESKIQMEYPERAHPKALEVNQYTPEAWAEARTAKAVFEEVHQRGLLKDCILAGHNVGFDARFINATFKRLGYDFRSDYHLFDTVTVALEHLQLRLDSVSLVPVCTYLGIPTDGAHSALADCKMAKAVYDALRIGGKGCNDGSPL